MNKRVLLFIKNMQLKAIILKYLVKNNFEVVEVSNFPDLLLKTEIYPPGFLLFIIEIDQDILLNFNARSRDLNLRKYLEDTSRLGIIPKYMDLASQDMLKYDFADLILEPASNENFSSQLDKKIRHILEKNRAYKLSLKYGEFDREIVEQIKQNIDFSIKHANRGSYSFSLIMIKLNQITRDNMDSFYERLEKALRTTDTIYQTSSDSLVVLCPYAEKKYIVKIENKISQAFMDTMQDQYKYSMINSFAYTYPEDKIPVEKILSYLLIGIENSLTIDSIDKPLRDLSKSELQRYKDKVKKYKDILDSF